MSAKFLCKKCMVSIKVFFLGLEPRRISVDCPQCGFTVIPILEFWNSYSLLKGAAVVYVDIQKGTYISFPPHQLLIDCQKAKKFHGVL